LKNKIKKVSKLLCFYVTTLVIAGCNGGGGGGSLGFLGNLGGSSSGAGSSGIGDTTLATYHNPEPSSILLLTSGLIGMAIYAKARLRGKGKR